MNDKINDQLIPLTDTDDGITAVMGRDLHEFLEVKTAYKDWLPRMVAYGFTEGQDYVLKNEHTPSPAGMKEKLNHIMSLDMAKEISMIQRTEKGKQARQYFIECEKRVKQALAIPQTYAEALRAAADAADRATALEAKAAEDAPKVEAYNSFIDADGTYSVGNVAKMIGLSQNKLFDRLRNTGILISKGAMRNTPYQKYMHHFSVKAYEYERADGERRTSYTTRVQPSGIEFINRKITLNSERKEP